MESATYEQIACTITEQVATVVLDRPERLNAATEQMVEELIDVFDRIDADDDVRAVVLTGRGRAFCAGADLAAGAGTFDYTGETEHRDSGGVLTLRMFALTKPLIVAVNGAAVGMGASMILPADIRLASTTARFAFSFVRRGIVPESCSSWFLPRVVGISRALEWMYTGDMQSADQALAAGLVRSIHAPEDVVSAAMDLARHIAHTAAPASVVITRRLMWRSLTANHPELLHEAESRALQLRGSSDDAREGVNAFLEKRDPTFTDSPRVDLESVLLDVGRPARALPEAGKG